MVLVGGFEATKNFGEPELVTVLVGGFEATTNRGEPELVTGLVGGFEVITIDFGGFEIVSSPKGGARSEVVVVRTRKIKRAAKATMTFIF